MFGDGPATGGDEGEITVSHRTKSGGILRRSGSSRYAVLSDQGHRRGFRICIYEDGQPLPMQATRTRAGVLWKEACALADQLLLTGFLPDAAQHVVPETGTQRTGGTAPRRSRASRPSTHPQLSLIDAGWPSPQRFPHNSRFSKVRDVVDADLLASDNPLVITGFVSMDSLLALLDRVARSSRVEGVRLRLGYEPYSASRTPFRVGAQRYADEIADYWLERGISLYLSGAVLSAIELLENGRAEARISGEAGIVHAKMYRTEHAVTIGSNNYSRPGLVEHIEANVRFAAEASISTNDSSEPAAEPVMGGQVEPDVVTVESPADAVTAESCNGSAPIELVPDTHVNGRTDSELPVGASASEPSTLQSEPMSNVASEREADRPRSDLLRQLDQAPLRMRCFGTRGVWFGERQIWPITEAVEDTGWELVVLLGIYPVAGIQAETLADTIWDEDTPPDPGSVLRKRRGRLRQELKRLVPELEIDALPTDPKGRVYRLDPRVIASDVHQFVELANWAKSLPRRDAVAAYEEALALYGGDLLESVAVPTYPWLYDGAAIATSLRPDYRRLQEEVRLRLADLYAAGSADDELSRAVDLYTELTAERPDDDRRWISLLRVQGRRGDGMALEASIRKLRTALVELGQAEKPETARLPLSIQRVLEEVQSEIRAQGETAVG